MTDFWNFSENIFEWMGEEKSDMNYYFAPLEGITGYIYRNAHHEFFPGMDKYFTPFLSPNQHHAVNPKEAGDIFPENNKGLYIVPQIMTKHADYFVRAAAELKEQYGYEEVNLNLGCPSRTVVSKGRGAGFLAKPEELDEFLQEVFEKTKSRVSIKTRLGMESPEEFYRLLEIYNKYPLHELIIHPRVQQDYYNNTPNWEMFGEAAKQSRNPLCYNGDIYTVEDYERLCEAFPKVERVMLGRGLLKNPALVQCLQKCDASKEQIESKLAKSETTDCQLSDKQTIKAFHDKLYADYKEYLSGDKPLLFKMKEVWVYMIDLFPNHDKYWKKIKKASRLCDYEEAVRGMFSEPETGRKETCITN